MLRWIKEAIAILREATPRWIITLAFAVIGGSLLLDEHYLRIVEWLMMHELGWLVGILNSPTTIWVAVVMLVWVMAGLLHKQVKQRYVEPRLYFDNARVWDTGIGPDSIPVVVHKTITVSSIEIRNNPVGNNGKKLHRAYCSVAFFDFKNKNSTQRIEYARWVDNPKPRKDETPTTMPVPKFSFNDNFADIEPNNSRYQIDFAVYHADNDKLYAFAGADQLAGWANPDHEVVGNHLCVCLDVMGNEISGSERTWVEMKIINGQLEIKELCDEQKKLADETYLIPGA